MLLYKACRENCHIIFKEEMAYIKAAAQQYAYEQLEHIVQAIEQARSRIKANVNQDLTMELLFFDMKS